MTWIKYRATRDGDNGKGKGKKNDAPLRYRRGQEFVLMEYGSVVALAPKGCGSEKGKMVKVFNSQFIDDFVPSGALTEIGDVLSWCGE